MVLTEEQIFEPLCLLFNQKISKFPGNLPVNVDQKNVGTLRQGYIASPKADGEQILGFICKNILLTLRRNKAYRVFNLTHCFSQCFIFNGEFIEKLDLILIYDMLLFNSEPCLRLDYLQRIELSNHFICMITPIEDRHEYNDWFISSSDVQPLPTQYQYGIVWKASQDIQLMVKPPYALDDVVKVWDAKHLLPYACDGMIFTRLWCAYKPFCDETMLSVLKWKPCVTIDFIVQPKLQQQQRDGGEDKGTLSTTAAAIAIPDSKWIPSEFESFSRPDDEMDHNAILLSIQDMNTVRFSCCVIPTEILDSIAHNISEFAWEPAANRWQWQRLRPDKTAPNTLHTVFACLGSIRDVVDISDIIR